MRFTAKHKFYTISFIEGASVMAAEICGAKLLAPFLEVVYMFGVQ